MSNRYAAAHEKLLGPGDQRPTALQVVKDEELEGKLKNKVVLITGCSAGLSVETARAMFATGATIFLTARNTDKARAALGEVAESPHVHLLEMDQTSLKSVRACAASFLEQSETLNIVINNAGIMAVPETTKEDGFKSQFQTNHLSHFLLFYLLKPTLLASANPKFASRVINLSSFGHRRGEPDLDNINLTRCYDKWRAYGSSKTCNIWMADEVEQRYGSKHLRAFSLYPGGIVTPLWDFINAEDIADLRSQGVFDESLKLPEQGAATTVWGAIAKCLEGDGGKYLDDVQIPGPWTSDQLFALPGWAPHAHDKAREGKLWKLSLDMAELKDTDL
ncbi:putative short-chain dehydrogenase protein [Botrytis fragariae]|uniref:Putative short-chain dehydrogenase protein n=1 Tax=Botrytis fragariae TaxID=1964551 RepID=A0A8H6APS1_9HELO|nr:putative short-chain dehydrogenase protein [Botrytis fragariae]KAF5871571.1 putative short-chain dehydrogenase protein [Botrytis fragariae]